MCAYHGWRYGMTGACTRIPALPAERPIPARARVDAYRVEERYGLIWACLGEPEERSRSSPSTTTRPTR